MPTTPTPADMDMTAEALRDLYRGGAMPGSCHLTGATCGQCKATANVRAGLAFAGWFCPCGAWNTNSRFRQFPFETPTYGPGRAAIEAALNGPDGD